jgi:deoxyribodipyrimidine photo-lyase
MITPGLSVVWFRQDLRVHDHAALTAAAKHGPVVCIYVLDPELWEPNSSQCRQLAGPRIGRHRTRFLLESLSDLRSQLRELGADLIVRRGAAATCIGQLLREVKAAELLFHSCVGTEEAAEELAVRQVAANAGVTVQSFWGDTLVPPEELPFAVEETPDTFTSFRKKIERACSYSKPLAAPHQLATLDDIEIGDIPDLEELAGKHADADPRPHMQMLGGESAGLSRLDQWCWQQDRLRRYKKTRNGMLGTNYSSRLSPWLAHGCLSPRLVQSEVARYESERVQNDSTYWLTFELLWRDYFQWIAKKAGAKIFRSSGLQGIPVPWRRDKDAFERWKHGTTGFPIVDASMRELLITGFISNRGRQIVASFLTKNLGIDWRWGAEWFEAMLLDYDVGSNYGNWNYGAGVGNDARGFRYFHLPTQAQKYDSTGAYARHWCPELSKVITQNVHAPWTLPDPLQEELGVVVGRDYPRPIIDLDRSVSENRSRWERAVQASPS